MEFLIGSFVTMAIWIVFTRVFNNKVDAKQKPLVFTQSHIHNTLYPILLTNEELEQLNPKNRQSVNHYLNTYIRVIFYEENAYWIKNNTLFQAEVIDGEVQKENAKEVDTITMDDVQLKKMIFIVDKLTEGLPHDRGYSGF